MRDGLEALARAASVPLKSVLLAAHCKVVALWSGRSEGITGLLSNGRPEVAGGDEVLGIFLNTVPFPWRSAAGSWRELVLEVFAAEHRQLPFRRYPMAELQREYGGGEALFDTVFNFTHFHIYQGLERVVGVEVLEHRGVEQTYFPLTAQFNRFGERLHLTLHHGVLDIPPAQARAMAESYRAVVSAMVELSLIHI